MSEDKIMYLQPRLSDCPAAWINFIEAEAFEGAYHTIEERVSQNKVRLAEYNGKYKESTVTFTTEEDLTLFVLNWS